MPEKLRRLGHPTRHLIALSQCELKVGVVSNSLALVRVQNAERGLRITFLKEEVRLQNGHTGDEDAIGMLLREGTEDILGLRQVIRLQIGLRFKIVSVVIKRVALHVGLAEGVHCFRKFTVEKISVPECDIGSGGGFASVRMRIGGNS